MATIQKLHATVINNIAAGQVIDRPAAVVKELVENALDAGAEYISVDLVGGGCDRITVVDDGHGMTRDDLELSIEAHATSKITTLDDLHILQTFGFRGEALAAIAHSGYLTIESRHIGENVGYSMTVINGEIEDIEPMGMPVGTRITVEKLFAAMPARRKSLSSSHIELKHVLRVVESLASAYMDVAFVVKNDGSERLNLPRRSSHMETVGLLFDAETASQYIPVAYSQEKISINGVIGKPEIAAKTEDSMYITVNKRPVQNPSLRKMIKAGYKTLLEARAQPVCIIDITFPVESLDVNVDPQKKLVRMMYEDVEVFLKEAVSTSLEKANLLYGDAQEHQDMDPRLAEIMRSSVVPWTMKKGEDAATMQIHNTYILFESSKGLLMIDQHAAHERILFEQYTKAFNDMEITKKILDKPVVLELRPSDFALYQEYASELHECGFRCTEFGGNSIKIDAVPQFMAERNISRVMQEVLEDIQEGSVKMNRKAHKTLAYLACRTAIKAGDSLSQKEMHDLIQKLLTCKNPYTCPHGRPTTYLLKHAEIEKLFKRK